MKIQKILDDISKTFNVLSYHIKKLERENKTLKNQIDKLHEDLKNFIESQKGR
tara:strand:+ start:352 stop:510 length:159 start_codon:yes stop_codon:yes gene_type:complete